MTLQILIQMYSNLYIGEAFEDGILSYTITSKNYDQFYDEQFESSAIVSDYTYNTPIESACFTVTLNAANVVDSKKTDKKSLECELTLKNNSNATESFMLGMEYGCLLSIRESLGFRFKLYSTDEL